MIRVENLSKNYDAVKAVRSISFDLQDGQVVGFLGANGAGKSTTLKIMTGYISPTSGNVFYNDKNIQDDTSEIPKSKKHQDNIFLDFKIDSIEISLFNYNYHFS